MCSVKKYLRQAVRNHAHNYLRKEINSGFIYYIAGTILFRNLHLPFSSKFAYHTNESNWETPSQRRKTSRICALFKAYPGERAWKAIGDRLQRPNYLSRVDHERKIRSSRQRTDIGKYSFVNRTIRLWNRLPAEILGTLPCKPCF